MATPTEEAPPSAEVLAKYRTAHQLAQVLLAGPDHTVVIISPVFDMPGQVQALPVKTEPLEIQGVKCIALLS